MWSEERIATLLRLRAEGKTFVAIARIMRESKGSIAGKLYRLSGYKRPSKPKTGRRGPEPDPNAVLAAAIVLDGGTYAEAMEETGLDWDAVRRAIMAAKSRELRDRRRMAEAERAAL